MYQTNDRTYFICLKNGAKVRFLQACLCRYHKMKAINQIKRLASNQNMPNQ